MFAFFFIFDMIADILNVNIQFSVLINEKCFHMKLDIYSLKMITMLFPLKHYTVKYFIKVWYIDKNN